VRIAESTGSIEKKATMVKERESALIHHQGIICGVAFARSSPGFRQGRLAAYCYIRLSRRSSAPSI